MNERNGGGPQSENSCARKTDAELISFLKYHGMLWRDIDEHEADACLEAARRLEDRQWIAVAERLPPEDGKILGIGPTADPAKLGVSMDWYTPGKGWSFQTAAWCEPSTHNTHWMKIPEPPEITEPESAGAMKQHEQTPKSTWEKYLASLNADQREKILEWISTRPPAVRTLFHRLPPGSTFVIDGRTAYVVSVAETNGEPGVMLSYTNPAEDYDGACATRFFVCVGHI